MLYRGVRLSFGCFALAFASSAGAQGSLDQGKSGAQLYALACAQCHTSAQRVARTKWFFGLESFLRQHYTSSSESAATLAAYLKNQEKLSAYSPPGRLARQTTQSKVSPSTVNQFGEEIPRPPAGIPDPKP